MIPPVERLMNEPKKSEPTKIEQNEELTRKLAKLIRIEREYQFSQSSLADALFCSRATVSRLESGFSVRSEYVLAALVELGLAGYFLSLLDDLLSEPPAKREADEKHRRFMAILEPYR